MIRVDQQPDGVTISVKVHPEARREGISGFIGDSLKIDLIAPPIEGRANEACIRFFAEFLKVPRSSVTIAAGANSRNKVIRVAGARASTVQQAIEIALARHQ